jgi:hypothetical protein
MRTFSFDPDLARVLVAGLEARVVSEEYQRHHDIATAKVAASGMMKS